MIYKQRFLPNPNEIEKFNSQLSIFLLECKNENRTMKEILDAIYDLSKPFFKTMSNTNKTSNKITKLFLKTIGKEKEKENLEYLYHTKMLEHKTKSLQLLTKYSKAWWRTIKEVRWKDWK
ncbi:hypothetical protein GJ496_000643 [Pomphorhynchus laevis]|nr:hypothetical protein GJ496_000643 [Pomphorhynchus laevis]